ncbi:M20/M25/M40 family metallo-hydrolase [Vibrio sp. SM6]|uniref:M20/M25/M40 family metallo-hydrolase n=1 Tax=Vibrio agarilyticus TaxID=2726741 RepID=A0A7X8TP82_9VIBR|nr:M20/M25/M40 family metallo-hydrolase [Vibrio agarilyticus]NLS12179.1 M20/M25/M40 family metallo-hydrolase [Vibrio agarilyticus]
MTTINQQRLVDHFIQLVKIDSESGNEKAMAETVAEQLGQLGFEVTKQAIPAEISNGFNVYGKLTGTLDGSILFSSHMDTVTPGNGIEPIIEDGIIRSKGDTILGGDDKSGIAAVMEAVRTLQENGEAHKTIEVAFTVYEELGLEGAKHFDLDLIQSQQAIVMDSGGPIGTVITVAPGQESLFVTVKGKPAHAGLAPETGINALTVAADAIGKMTLGRIDFETTANIGVVRGGQATNIVMPELYLEAEARSLDDDKLAAQVSHMVSTFETVAEQHGAAVEITTSRSYNAYRIADEDDHVVAIKAAFASIGIESQCQSTGGGSDANIFNARGLKTVNLSTGMAKVHTTEEYIAVADMVAITEFIRAYVRQ